MSKAGTNRGVRETERERFTFSLAGQMKESGEKAKGISLTPQLPGLGEGEAAARGLFLLSDRRGRTRTAEAAEAPQSAACLPLLSVRPHDSTSQRDINANQVYSAMPPWPAAADITHLAKKSSGVFVKVRPQSPTVIISRNQTKLTEYMSMGRETR